MATTKAADYQRQFEAGLHALIDHFVGAATRRYETRIATQADLLARLQGQLTLWPIVGTTDVQILRQAVREQVSSWFLQDLPDLQPSDRPRLDPGSAAVARYRAAQMAGCNLLYRRIEAAFLISELKALPVKDVAAALAIVRQTATPFEALWTAYLRKAIHQRVAFWQDRGFIGATDTDRIIAIQAVWRRVRAAGIDPAAGPGARRQILRRVFRAEVPLLYRAAQ